MHSLLHSVGETLMPVLKNSKFKETGVITPEEFVAAGDFLVFKCPTWAWSGGEDSKRRPYLPADKQFLVTRNVPCFKRVKNMEYTDIDEQMVEGAGEDWVDTFHSQHIAPGVEEELAEMTLNERPVVTVAPLEESEGSDSDIPDMDEFEEENIDDDQTALQAQPDDNILRTRTYDLSITYDKYYQTPRMWLKGYDEAGKPLSNKEMFEDFSQDHAHKTVTIEAHPHMASQQASIHPCKHSNVMKRIMSTMAEAKTPSNEELMVHMYLMIFLKFVQSVIPTIEYDYTREFSMA